MRELFGLTFDQFITCVVLPQGDFARFLHETPRERQALLKELIGIRVYDQMRKQAVARESRARQRVATLNGQLEELADEAGVDLDALEQRIEALGRLRKAVTADATALRDLEREVVDVKAIG